MLKGSDDHAQPATTREGEAGRPAAKSERMTASRRARAHCAAARWRQRWRRAGSGGGLARRCGGARADAAAPAAAGSARGRDGGRRGGMARAATTERAERALGEQSRQRNLGNSRQRQDGDNSISAAATFGFRNAAAIAVKRDKRCRGRRENESTNVDDAIE
ncbi:hypothetical protein Scep_013348 [Stephania cephalantha]|uniref:Uncharacterized protein n=1 Tax=Stephania cephalantha TaxID=152367 RepID=A0AAP0JHP4_9MAGN